MYTKEELLGTLTTEVVGKKVFVFDTIDSTNSCARALGDAGAEEGAVVVSDYQTNGRGRLGRSWLAEPGANLLFSVLLRPPISLERSALLTFYASAAVARAVEHNVRETIECKWPNDLLIHGKKFCGILLENSFQQAELTYAVIGIGLNINQTELPEDIAARATSLARESGSPLDRKALFRSVIAELDSLYPAVRLGDFNFVVKEWNKRCSMFGKAVTVQEHDRVVRGTALRLHSDGALILDTSDGQRTLYAGDVTLVG